MLWRIIYQIWTTITYDMSIILYDILSEYQARQFDNET